MKKAMSLVLIVLALVGCTAPDKPSVSLYLAVQRGDLEQVEQNTTPVFDYYAKQGKSAKVWGIGSLDTIFERLCLEVDFVKG